MAVASIFGERGGNARRGPGAGKVALVLSGGGIPGWMYEIGCLTALDEFFEAGFSSNDFNIFVGTSAGANAAALMANGIRPRAIYDAVMADDASPFNFRREDIYAFGTGETWPTLRKAGAALFRASRHLALGVVRKRRRPSLLDLAYAVQEILPSGIFTLKPLERHLREHLSREPYSNDFRTLRGELFIPAVDLDRGEYVVFGADGFDRVPISRAVAASSAVPVLFQPVRIDGVDYIDGGIGRVANMDVAIRHGAGLLVVINPVVHLENDRKGVCLPTCHGFCRGLRDKGMSFVADQAMRINTSIRLRLAREHHRASHPGIDIAIIEPDPKDTFMFTQNVVGHEARKEVLRYGYRATVTHLGHNFEALRDMFGRRGIAVGLGRFRWRPKVGGLTVMGPNERQRVADALPADALPDPARKVS
ncbi:MAG: patatin-like phospholipase family protein [Nitrospirae bacterium]|nr:patatin-like phospholipase family protein [Nitrospirota bacterium]